MQIVIWDHVHLRSPDPEATAAWLENILGGVIIQIGDRLFDGSTRSRLRSLKENLVGAMG